MNVVRDPRLAGRCLCSCLVLGSMLPCQRATQEAYRVLEIVTKFLEPFRVKQ